MLLYLSVSISQVKNDLDCLYCNSSASSSKPCCPCNWVSIALNWNDAVWWC